jgi:hypothetical protein
MQHLGKVLLLAVIELTKHWSTIDTTDCSFVFVLSSLNFINNVVLLLDLILSKRRVMLLLTPEDVHAYVELGLEICNASQDKVVVQVTHTNQDFSIYSTT